MLVSIFFLIGGLYFENTGIPPRIVTGWLLYCDTIAENMGNSHRQSDHRALHFPLVLMTSTLYYAKQHIRWYLFYILLCLITLRMNDIGMIYSL